MKRLGGVGSKTSPSLFTWGDEWDPAFSRRLVEV